MGLILVRTGGSCASRLPHPMNAHLAIDEFRQRLVKRTTMSTLRPSKTFAPSGPLQAVSE